MGRVERALGRVEEGMQKSLMRLKNLQAPNYPYPYLVAVKEIQAKEKRKPWIRLRGIFVKDMTLHFLCPFDMSKVPCGDGGNGYRLCKKRGWVEKIAPALQVDGCCVMLSRSTPSLLVQTYRALHLLGLCASCFGRVCLRAC